MNVAPMKVEREQVIAYRVAAQGLHRAASSVADLAVLDLGVQEAMGQPAGYAYAARLPMDVDVSPAAVAVGPGADLALAWTLRGAPHVHRRTDLDPLAAALWPLSEADAATRLNETGPSVQRAGIPALEQFAIAVDAVRAVVTDPIAKGAASTEISRRIPAAMRRDCRPCRAEHISDSALRAASLAAGVELEPDTAPPVLVPRDGAGIPRQTDVPALTRLARHYLELLGPARDAEFAGYLEARRADVARAWPGSLAEMSLNGRSTWLPADRLDALRDAPEPAVVRLLGSFDPYLQARDRELIVPDKAVRKTLWPVLGRPGAVFVDGEVVGTWRTRATASRARLTITVEAFATISKPVWTQLESEAERVAQVRGCVDVVLTRKS